MTSAYPGFYAPQHHKHTALEREIFSLPPQIHVFSGYSMSNCSVIIGKDGYILIDTGDNLHGADEILREIQQRTDLPLRAIILTHSHPDHRAGGEAFLKAAQGEIPIWGHKDFGSEQPAAGLERISAARAKRQFGVAIPDELYTPNSLVPRISGAVSGKPVSPNTFASQPVTKVDIAGIHLELHAIPGETADHLLVWLPGEKILFGGDNVYRSFPNLYPIRGCGFRDIARWAKSVRRMMDFDAKAVVFGHNQPAIGDEVQSVLGKYNEAIQYVYDATVAGMDAGLTADELAASIQLPPHLRDEPYLGEFYGCVPWSVRTVFSGLMGWFDGNPSTLIPLAPAEEAEHMAQLAGGAKALCAQAEKALKEKDWRWATKLADYLPALGFADAGKRIKADALEALSKEILPISGKNYLLSYALELRQNKK